MARTGDTPLRIATIEPVAAAPATRCKAESVLMACAGGHATPSPDLRAAAVNRCSAGRSGYCYRPWSAPCSPMVYRAFGVLRFVAHEPPPADGGQYLVVDAWNFRGRHVAPDHGSRSTVSGLGRLRRGGSPVSMVDAGPDFRRDRCGRRPAGHSRECDSRKVHPNGGNRPENR